MEPCRCPWCLGDAAYIEYHDAEWGVPLRDDRRLFELLLLEGAQAGLSWLTVLKRREGYRSAFSGMNPEVIARYGDADVERLMGDARIIRNRRKILSAVGNARAYLALRETAAFSDWLWDWVDGEPLVNCPRALSELPVSTPLSERVAKELKRRGFSFVGSTIVYSFMQSAGLVNDHLADCFRHPMQQAAQPGGNGTSETD